MNACIPAATLHSTVKKNVWSKHFYQFDNITSVSPVTWNIFLIRMEEFSCPPSWRIIYFHSVFRRQIITAASRWWTCEGHDSGSQWIPLQQRPKPMLKEEKVLHQVHLHQVSEKMAPSQRKNLERGQPVKLQIQNPRSSERPESPELHTQVTRSNKQKTCFLSYQVLPPSMMAQSGLRQRGEAKKGS